MDTKRLLTLGETSSALGVSHQTVRRMVARGELAFVRVGKRLVRIPAAEVEHLLRAVRQPEEG